MDILTPTERATSDVSADSSLVSDVVPMYVAIKRALQSISDESGVQTMKKEIMKELDTRFSDVKTEPLFVVATLFVTRYRGKLLSGNEMADAQNHLIELAVTNKRVAKGTMVSVGAQLVTGHPIKCRVMPSCNADTDS